MFCEVRWDHRVFKIAQAHQNGGERSQNDRRRVVTRLEGRKRRKHIQEIDTLTGKGDSKLDNK